LKNLPVNRVSRLQLTGAVMLDRQLQRLWDRHLRHDHPSVLTI
jgi:hypothetical protein